MRLSEKKQEMTVGRGVCNNKNAPTSNTTKSYTASINTTESNNIQYGWVCPKCGRVNAPWKDHCDCTEYGNDYKWWKWWEWPCYPLDYPDYPWTDNPIPCDINGTTTSDVNSDLTTQAVMKDCESIKISWGCSCCDNHKSEESK